MAQDASEQPLTQRLSALERRVAALERRDSHGGRAASAVDARPSADSTEAERGLDPERFWALIGLRQRIGAGSAVLFTGSVNLPGNRAYVWQQGVDAFQLLDGDVGPVADALAALGHPIRLGLLRAVLQGAATTAELGATEGVGTSGQLYHHLRELTAAGWLTSAARGRYEVPPARLIPLLVAIAAAQG